MFDVANAPSASSDDRLPVADAADDAFANTEADRTATSSCSNVLGSVSVLLRFCLPEVRLNWPAVFVCSLRLVPRLRCWRRGDSPSY